MVWCLVICVIVIVLGENFVLRFEVERSYGYYGFFVYVRIFICGDRLYFIIIVVEFLKRCYIDIVKCMID